MLSRFYTMIILLFLLTGITAYSQQLYKPALADAQRTGIPVDTLLKDRKL